MIAYLILGTVGLYLLFEFPLIILGAGIILYVLYISNDTGKSAGEEQESTEDTTDPAIKDVYGEFVKDGAVDLKGYNDSKVEEMMKPGFRDDPEWQRMSAEIKESMRQSRIEADREMQETINEESNEKEQTFWRKVR